MRVTRTSSGRRILTATTKEAHRTISRGVDEGLSVGHRLCPVDKGDLKSTYTKEDDGRGHATLGTGGPSKVSDRYVNHHIYIEHGTSKMPAQPNYRPGVEAAKEYIKRNQRIVGG